MLPNYKAIGQRQAFHSLKVKKLDVCVGPFLQVWLNITVSVMVL